VPAVSRDLGLGHSLPGIGESSCLY